VVQGRARLEVNPEPNWYLLVQVRVCWDKHILMVFNIVWYGGWRGVGQLWQGGGGSAVQGDTRVVVLDLSSDVVQVVHTEFGTFNLLPPSWKPLCLKRMGPVGGLTVVVYEVFPPSHSPSN